MNTEDISTVIGPIEDTRAERPMYSYDRPANRFWQGAYDELRGQGWTPEQAFEFLQSKHTRWMFDGSASEVCEFMGKIMTRQYVITNRLRKGEL